MGGTVAALVLDVMGGVLLVGTVAGAIVPVGDTSLVVAAGTVHVSGRTLHVTVAATIPNGKVAVITLHPTVGTIKLDVTAVSIRVDVVELKGTSGIEQDGTVAGVTADGIFAASCCLFLRWYVDHQFFIWIPERTSNPASAIAFMTSCGSAQMRFTARLL